MGNRFVATLRHEVHPVRACVGAGVNAGSASFFLVLCRRYQEQMGKGELRNDRSCEQVFVYNTLAHLGSDIMVISAFGIHERDGPTSAKGEALNLSAVKAMTLLFQFF